MKAGQSSSGPSWWVSLMPFVILIVTLATVIRAFEGDALGGPGQVALLFASGIAVAISMFFYKTPWSLFEEAICENVKTAGQAILILILIGAISGSWMVSGVVPMLICYGLKVITPGIFLLAACIICALVSVMTGSSWTTIATLGVALVGIGTALGYSPGWTAGAIISGAYFGDKISPLSDTTVLASSMAGTPLFRHIRYMLITTVPSILIACTVFLIVSLCHKSPDAAKTTQFAQALRETFHISPWLLIVPVITGVLVARKVPAIITLFVSAMTAGICAIIAQPEIVWGVAHAGEDCTYQSLGFMDGFKGLFTAFSTSTSVDTGDASLNELVATRGMKGMLDTVFLILCAGTFGGTLKASGMIQSLTDAITSRISSRTAMVSATSVTGICSNMMTGDQFLSIILTSSLYKKLYDDRGFDSSLLSRTVEDSTTVTSVLIPWNSCGMTQSTVLKVPTIDYLPYCIFNLLSPLMTIFIAAVGYKIALREQDSAKPSI